jgi:hypothetical protein
MLSNVFNRKGPDTKSFGVNVFPHYKTNWLNAQYQDGEVRFGDGWKMQTVDTVGHEQGHGLVDFTANLPSSGLAGGINEAIGDVFGSMSSFYLKGGGWAAASKTIPDDKGTWTVGAGTRYMPRPSLSSPVSLPNYWYPKIDQLDPHEMTGPFDRAFYFLSQGAGQFVQWENYSTLLPFGSVKIGNQKAGQIWYNAVAHYLVSDPDAMDFAYACYSASANLFGVNSQERKSVENSFAAVGIGWPEAFYPKVPVTLEVEPNNSKASAMKLTRPSNSLNGSPDKAHILGGGTDDDWYAVTLGPQESIGIRLEPIGMADYDIHIYDSNLNQLAASTNPGVLADFVQYTQPYQILTPKTYYVKVHLYTPWILNQYQMFIDFY